MILSIFFRVNVLSSPPNKSHHIIPLKSKFPKQMSLSTKNKTPLHHFAHPVATQKYVPSEVGVGGCCVVPKKEKKRDSNVHSAS